MNEKHAAKYTYYYLLSLIALVFLGVSIGLVYFGVINRSILDPLLNNYYSYSGISGSLKFAISAILIATPIYFSSTILIEKGLKKKELSPDSGVRKFLTYFILLVSSLIILGVFITIIYQFLDGGLGLKLFLKSLTVFLISALVFSYYFYDIKNGENESAKMVKKIFFYFSLVVVVGSFILALFFVESPRAARERRSDEKLLNNISRLQYQVEDYYYKNKALPVLISDLSKKDSFNRFDENNFIDPETGEAIVYNKKGELEFELCGTFRTSNLEDIDSYMIQHDKGYYCLNKVIDKIETKVFETEIIHKD